MKAKTLAEIEALAATVKHLARRGMTPRQLLDAVRGEHPGVTKKALAQAAFCAVILAAEEDTGDVTDLHELAMKARDEDSDPS